MTSGSLTGLTGAPVESATTPLAWWFRRAQLLVGLVVVAGVGLRLWSPSALWLDEAQSVMFASLPLSDLHGALRTDGAPPLYYALLHGWLSLLDSVGLGADGAAGVWAPRSFSMLTSIAALPLAYLAGLRIGGTRRHAVLTLLLLASNPWAVRYAGEARMYSLLVLLVLLGILAADWLRRQPGPAPVVAVAAVVAALLYTHIWAVFLLAAVGALVLHRAWRHPEDRLPARRAVIGLVAGGCAFLPWVPTMLYQSAHTGSPWAPTPDLGSLAQLPIEWGGGRGPAGASLALLIVPMLLLAVFARRGRDGAVVGAPPSGVTAVLGAVTALTLLIALVVSVVGGGAVIGRYTAVVIPTVVLLLAFGIRVLPRRPAAVVLAAMVGLGLAGGQTMATTPHSHAGAVAAELNDAAGRGDVVVYCPDQLAPGVEARLDVRGVDRVTVPAQTDPAVVDWTDYEARIDALRLPRIAEEIAGSVKADPDASAWLVLGENYRTHKKICDPLRTLLVAELGIPVEMHSRNSRGHEKATLERFR